jgi:hypothetical protein
MIGHVTNHGDVSPGRYVRGERDFNQDVGTDLAWRHETSCEIAVWSLDGVAFA